MAEKDEDSLIGYDPLAWMHRTNAEQGEQATESDVAQQMASFESEGSIDEPSMVSETAGIQMPTVMTENTSPGGSEEAVLVLEPVLNIQNVSALHQRLIQMLNNFDAIDIDASSVTMIDTATLQLLLILKQTAVGLQKSIAIDFPSDRFIEAAELLGVAEMLEVDQAASGFF